MCDSRNIVDFEALLSSEPLSCKIALIQLNTPLLEENMPIFTRLWEGATLVAAVDGGINRLYDSTLDPDRFIPHIVTGDFDSARPDILEFYRNKGSKIIATPDQNETDLTKCVAIVKETIEKENVSVSSIIVHMPHSSRRFDHMMAAIDTLYKSQEMQPHLPLYFLSNNGLICLLAAGSNVLHFPIHLNHTKCGLIPIGQPCNNVTTCGLRWNMSGKRLAFGELISACNELDTATGIVTVETDEPLVWTMSFLDG